MSPVICVFPAVTPPRVATALFQHTISAELEGLEQRLAQPAADGAVRAQALSVAIYCHLLGYDVRFICIHAITLAQQGSLLQKRIGTWEPDDMWRWRLWLERPAMFLK